MAGKCEQRYEGIDPGESGGGEKPSGKECLLNRSVKQECLTQI